MKRAKTGGRKKGTPNKDISGMREALTIIYNNNTQHFEEWFKKVAEKNPERSIELTLRMAEYVLPKLTREIKGIKDEESITYKVNFGNDNN